MNKRLQKFLTLTILVASIILATNSCTKYEEGGYASKTKLCNKWVSYNHSFPGNDIPEYSTRWTFKRNGEIIYEMLFNNYTVGYPQHLRWEWVNKKKGIIIHFERTIESYMSLNIIKLTNKELWFEIESYGSYWGGYLVAPYEGRYMKLKKE